MANQASKEVRSTSTTDGGGQQGSNNSRIGIIVGVTLAGVLILLGALTAYLLWKKRKEQAQLDNKAQPDYDFNHGASADASQSERFFQGTMSTTPRAGKGVFSAVRPSHELEANASSPLTSENLYSSRVSQLSELEDSSRTPRSPHQNLVDTPHRINELE
ncbi:hypothetical protein GGR51DRAFT_574384 [Nemania sp. FL0031]|nr:hypothetical protein GGR51DRAFT_574384 [Nemania sp. FL0031]